MVRPQCSSDFLVESNLLAQLYLRSLMWYLACIKHSTLLLRLSANLLPAFSLLSHTRKSACVIMWIQKIFNYIRYCVTFWLEIMDSLSLTFARHINLQEKVTLVYKLASEISTSLYAFLAPWVTFVTFNWIACSSSSGNYFKDTNGTIYIWRRALIYKS